MLLVKAIKIVVNTPFAVTCLTYDALERVNEDISIQHVLMWACVYGSDNIIASVPSQLWQSVTHGYMK